MRTRACLLIQLKYSQFVQCSIRSTGSLSHLLKNCHCNTTTGLQPTSKPFTNLSYSSAKFSHRNIGAMDTAEGGDGGFQPKEDLLNILLSLGFSRNASIKGLYYTGNNNADLAAAWVIENQDKSNIDAPLNEDESEDSDEEDYFPDGVDFFKMVFVVNGELNMGVGKIAAQVAHAALGLHRTLLDDPQKFGQMLMSWEQFGETKIVTRGETAAQIMALAEKASSLGLPHYIVHDAGKTQIASGSTTVLAIMGKLDVVDSITGTLKLL